MLLTPCWPGPLCCSLPFCVPLSSGLSMANQPFGILVYELWEQTLSTTLIDAIVYRLRWIWHSKASDSLLVWVQRHEYTSTRRELPLVYAYEYVALSTNTSMKRCPLWFLYHTTIQKCPERKYKYTKSNTCIFVCFNASRSKNSHYKSGEWVKTKKIILYNTNAKIFSLQIR